MKLAHLIKNEFPTPVTVTVPTVVTVDPEKAVTVTSVTAVTVSRAENAKIQWESFIDECVMQGTSADEVAAIFHEQDIEDLCEEPAEKLHLHARTIVDVIRRKRKPVVIELAPAEKRYVVHPSHVQRCIDCLHFNQIEHPHLGTCNAGEPEGIAGNWDTELRSYCQSWQTVTSKAVPEVSRHGDRECSGTCRGCAHHPG